MEGGSVSTLTYSGTLHFLFFFFVLFFYFSFLIRYFEAFKLLLLVSRNLSFRWNLRNGGSRFVAVMVSERSGFW